MQVACTWNICNYYIFCCFLLIITNIDDLALFSFVAPMLLIFFSGNRERRRYVFISSLHAGDCVFT